MTSLQQLKGGISEAVAAVIQWHMATAEILAGVKFEAFMAVMFHVKFSGL
jgi:hypothetical protein